MELLSLNVAIMKIEAVMRSVFKLHPNRVPKHTTINSIIGEAHVIAQMQLGESLPSKAFTTLHSDGTSKFGQKYQMCTQSSTYTLGIREVSSETSQTQFCTFQEIINEISDALVTTTEAGKKIVANIKCTMSDRANSQKCFNDMLNTYCISNLPDVVNEWANISEDEQQAMCSMYKYSNEALHLFEKAILVSESSSSEAGTICLIRTACKAFEKHSDEKSGCGHYLSLQTWLLSKSPYQFLWKSI